MVIIRLLIHLIVPAGPSLTDPMFGYFLHIPFASLFLLLLISFLFFVLLIKFLFVSPDVYSKLIYLLSPIFLLCQSNELLLIDLVQFAAKIVQ